MVAIEALAVTNSISEQDRKPVIRIDLKDRKLSTTVLPDIQSKDILAIAEAKNIQILLREEPNIDDPLAQKILSFRIPHRSDFLHHAKGFRLALYRALKVNYLRDRRQNPG